MKNKSRALVRAELVAARAWEAAKNPNLTDIEAEHAADLAATAASDALELAAVENGELEDRVA